MTAHFSDCAFCRIADFDEDEPAHVVRDAPAWMIIEPLNPVTEGHVLVIPRGHHRNALSSFDTTAMIMRIACEYAAGIGGDFNFITSLGKQATQTIEHLHIHVVPRRAGDGLPLPWSHPDTLRKYLEQTPVRSE